MGNVGRDPIDYMLLLTARQFGDAVEDLTHLTSRSAVSLGCFLLERLLSPTIKRSSTLTPRASAIFDNTSERGGFSQRSQKAMLA
jgi:hypothetical protein